MHWRRTLGALGGTRTAAGVLALLFVAHQLWGTGLRTAQAQDRLEDDLRAALAEAATTATAPPATSAPTSQQRRRHRRRPFPRCGPKTCLAPVRKPDGYKFRPSDSTGCSCKVSRSATSGAVRGTTRRPPCPARPATPPSPATAPTFGAPFNRIDELEPGDEIIVTTAQVRFRCLVTGQRVVDPSSVEVLDAVDGANLLTLTSCHQKYSARQRIVVQADLAGYPLPAVVPPAAEAQRDAPRRQDVSVVGCRCRAYRSAGDRRSLGVPPPLPPARSPWRCSRSSSRSPGSCRPTTELGFGVAASPSADG